MDASFALQAFFVSAAGGILLINSIPTLRNRFILYGARSQPSSIPTRPDQTQPSAPTQTQTQTQTEAKAQAQAQTPSSTRQKTSLINTVLDVGSALQLPHTWFIHFYIVSVGMSLFWAAQVLNGGAVFAAIARYSRTSLAGSMTLQQAVFAWTLMFAQGLRRLFESSFLPRTQARNRAETDGKVTSGATSKMWIGHWALGVLFYLAMSVAVWADAVSVLRSATPSSLPRVFLQAPSLRILLAFPAFLVASGMQYDCHAHLVSLKKYSLPTHPAFRFLVCPHYFAECLIYLSLAVLAAPRGQVVNKPIFAALCLVVVNLGVTARTSRSWYARRFGDASVHGKWCMIPFLY